MQVQISVRAVPKSQQGEGWREMELVGWGEEWALLIQVAGMHWEGEHSWGTVNKVGEQQGVRGNAEAEAKARKGLQTRVRNRNHIQSMVESRGFEQEM